jgi:hypothetical protein
VRHQRDINSCLEILRNLRQEECVRRYKEDLRKHAMGEDPQGTSADPDLRGAAIQGSDLNAVRMEVIKPRYLDDDNGYNKGLSNGLVGSEKDDDTWDRVYYDFFELKASMDALEKHADKIQEGMIGLLSIRISQSSKLLNGIGFMFSVLIIPWSFVSGVFSTEFDEGGFRKKRSVFISSLMIAVVVVAVVNAILYYGQKLFAAKDIIPQWINFIKGKSIALREILAGETEWHLWKAKHSENTARDSDDPV